MEMATLLETSKVNLIDPTIIVVWCKCCDVPIEKVPCFGQLFVSFLGLTSLVHYFIDCSRISMCMLTLFIKSAFYYFIIGGVILFPRLVNLLHDSVGHNIYTKYIFRLCQLPLIY